MLKRYYQPLPERYIRYQGKTIHFSACWYTIAKFLSTDPTLTLCPNNYQFTKRLRSSWWNLTSQHPVKSQSPLPSTFHPMTLQSLVHTQNLIILWSLKIIIKKSNSVPAVLILLWSPERCQTSCSQLWDSQSLWIFKDNKRTQLIFNYNHWIRTINWTIKVRMEPIMKEHKWLCAALKITLTWQFSSVHSPLYLLNCWQKLLWSIRTKVNNYVNMQNASTKPRSNAIRQTHSFAVQKQYKVKNNSRGKIEKSYSRISVASVLLDHGIT